MGEPYTPPGRTAVFDVPAYDDIADLHELFKRFANTCAAYSEAGGGQWVDKTAGFTVGAGDLFKTYLCTWTTVQQVTMPAASTGNEGDRITVIQGGTGKVQVAGADVVGTVSTGGQYQGLTVTLHDGKWWCVPFGSSGGGSGGGPIPVTKVSADYTIAAKDAGSLIVVDTVNGNRKITVPADDGSIPIGTAVGVANVGVAPSATVTIIGASGVILQDRANVNIVRYKSLSLVKREANIWLINAGGGEGGGAAPTAPKDVQAFGAPGGIIVAWEAPDDDGGHTVTSYIVEYGSDQSKLDKKLIVDGETFSLQIGSLAQGTTYYAWVKAANSVGISDPSSIVSAVPTQDYNNASGGNPREFSFNGRLYRSHTFTTSGELTITKSVNPFQVMVVAGGTGGGDSFSGYGGNGGGVNAFVLPPNEAVPGKYSFTVGSGGGVGNPGRPGTGSSAFGRAAAPNAGAGGGAPYGNPDPGTGYPGGTGVAWSYAAGTTDYYGSGGGGGGGIDGQPGPSGPGTYGRGGRGANWSDKGFGGEGGQNGVVIVTYEVAPYNDAVGGEITDVDNYNGTGQKWRVHTFKNSSDLIVKNASKPFRVLLVAGGGGGAGGGPYYGGGGGGGAGGLIFKEEQVLAAGTYPVTIGQGGAGGEGAREGAHNGVPGAPGGATEVAGLQAIGGGGGQSYQGDGSSGGSGGGGYAGRGGYPGTPGQGNAGGQGGNPGGGTGGGAGADGNAGGPGRDINITGTVVRYANGAVCVDSGAASGAANSGNGGQATRGGSPQYGGNGGSGVFIVAYQIG